MSNVIGYVYRNSIYSKTDLARRSWLAEIDLHDSVAYASCPKKSRAAHSYIQHA